MEKGHHAHSLVIRMYAGGVGNLIVPVGSGGKGRGGGGNYDFEKGRQIEYIIL